MAPPIVGATVQAVILSATSNIIAQSLQAYQSGKPLNLDTTSLFNFILFALLNTPPNFLWQQFLEETFPAYDVKPVLVQGEKEKDASGGPMQGEIVPKKTLNKKNTAIKFSLDQTFGALFNTVAFIAGMGALKGAGWQEISAKVQKDTIPLMMAGYKLWPLVSLLSFTVIPFQYRMGFGGLVGMGWGIFLSLFAS